MNHIGRDGRMMKDVTIGGLTVGNTRPLLVIAGPCQLESLDHAQMIAGVMAEGFALVRAGDYHDAAGRQQVGLAAEMVAGCKRQFDHGRRAVARFVKRRRTA